jgi:nucleoside-diphosphate-sugar epimerase
MQMTCRRVLVTGAYGLVGHETVHALDEAGFEAVPSDILQERPSDVDFNAHQLKIAGVDAIFRFLQEHGIDAVVHAGGVSGPMLGRSQPHAVLSTNAGGVLDLYEAARRASVRRIVLASSSGAYGETGEAVVDECMPLGATDVYGVSKICSERIAQAYAHHGVETVILRPSWIYGPRRRTTCVIKTMIENALSNRPTHLPYGAGFPRQFVYVSDVAESILAALTTSKGVQRAYNVTDGMRYLLDEVAMLVRERLPGANIELDEGPDPDDVVCGRLSISAAKADLGWEPKIDLCTGLDLMIADLLGHH